MSDNLKHKIVSGFLWQGLDRIGTQGLQLVISVILARLLMPEDFGVLAVMSVFVVLCQVFVDSGFSTALIQKKDADELDCNSVFYINLVMAASIYGILFLVAPLVAKFYNKPEITLYLRILALILPLRSFALVQTALLNKKMLFYLNCRISWAAVVVSGTVGIIMAYKGCGVWALIVQQLISALATSLLQCFWVRWKPALIFNWVRAKALFRFGWKIFCSALLDSAYNELYTILIGKLFNLKTLSFYQQGRAVPAQGMNLVNSTVISVMLPAFSALQNDREQMHALAQKSLKITAFLLIPFMGILLITAHPLVMILFTAKWEPCVIFLQLSCIISLFWPLHALNLQIITACGRSDVFLILEIIKKVQGIILILLTYRFGVLTMVCGLAAITPVVFIENSFYNGKLISYHWYKQLRDLLPYILTCAIAGGFGAWGMTLVNGNWYKLFTGAAVMGFIYLTICVFFKLIPEDIYMLVKKFFTSLRSSHAR